MTISDFIYKDFKKIFTYVTHDTFEDVMKLLCRKIPEKSILRLFFFCNILKRFIEMVHRSDGNQSSHLFQTCFQLTD